MSVINKLSSSLGQRDNEANKALAKELADHNDNKGVAELVAHLDDKNKNIKSDCIKTLYELGELKPALVAGHVNTFIALLDSKDNRMQWGAMTALSSIVAEKPKELYAALGKLVAVSAKGSVITKDHWVKILTRLCDIKAYRANAFALLSEQILNSPVNQLPTYAENALPYVSDEEKPAFAQMLRSRLHDVTTDTKRKRLEKVIEKLSSKAKK